MHLHVGRYRYTVTVVENLRHSATGEAVYGLCDWQARAIRLDAGLDREQRRSRLKHEFFHAADFVIGKAKDGEDQADRHAHLSDELDHQIEEVGGWQVLDAMYDRLSRGEPAPRAMPATAQLGKLLQLGAMPASRFECRCCQAPNLVRDVSQSAARMDAELSRLVIDRWFACHTCDAENRWTEYATESGMPTGEGVPQRHPPAAISSSNRGTVGSRGTGRNSVTLLSSGGDARTSSSDTSSPLASDRTVSMNTLDVGPFS